MMEVCRKHGISPQTFSAISLTRRTILRTGALAAAATLLPSQSQAAPPAGTLGRHRVAGPSRHRQLHFHKFARHISSTSCTPWNLAAVNDTDTSHSLIHSPSVHLK